MLLIWDLVERATIGDLSPVGRRIMRARSIVTLCAFAFAAVVAFAYPLVGLGICCCCLLVYLNPDVPDGVWPLPNWLNNIRRLRLPRR
jgi:hypothetical protein